MSPEHFRSAHLEVRQEVGVMHPPLPVRLLVPDADLQFVRVGHRLLLIAAAVD
jgi:hypothetical protein